MNPNSAPVDAPVIVPGLMVAQGPDAAGVVRVNEVATPAVPLNTAHPELVEGLPFVSPAYVPVRAAEDMLRVRTDQIFTHGHTPEADAARPLKHFARDLENLARAIREDEQFGKPADQIRRRAVKLGALAMAIIDKLDHEQEPSLG